MTLLSFTKPPQEEGDYALLSRAAPSSGAAGHLLSQIAVSRQLWVKLHILGPQARGGSWSLQVLGQQVLTSGRQHTHRSQSLQDHTHRLSAKTLEEGSRRREGGDKKLKAHPSLLIPAARHPQLKRWVLTRTPRTLSTQTRFRYKADSIIMTSILFR